MCVFNWQGLSSDHEKAILTQVSISFPKSLGRRNPPCGCLHGVSAMLGTQPPPGQRPIQDPAVQGQTYTWSWCLFGSRSAVLCSSVFHSWSSNGHSWSVGAGLDSDEKPRYMKRPKVVIEIISILVGKLRTIFYTMKKDSQWYQSNAVERILPSNQHK